NDGLREPLRTVVRPHRFAERHEDADVGILADELGDAVTRVFAGELSRRREMERYVMRAGEVVGEVDVVEALQNPDAAPVCLSSNPAEHRNVLLELRGWELLRFGIFRKLQQ